MPTGFSGLLPPERFNMAGYCLAKSAAKTPGKTALVVLTETGPDENWTYEQLDLAVRSVATHLRDYGHQPGDRVMIHLPNTSAYAILFFGVLAAGLVALPTSDMLTDNEAQLIMDDAEISVIATDQDQPRKDTGITHYSPQDIVAMQTHPHPMDYAPTNANDPAYLIYTSGTTSRPKGVLHAHRAAWGRRPMYRDWYGMGPDDRMLHAGAFNWTYTLGTGLTDPWANGATTIVSTGRSRPEDWPERICKTNATLFAAVPGLYRQILKYATPGPIDLGALRHGLTAGETLPTSIASEWHQRTGTRLHEALGMSEISTYISGSPERPAAPGTIGQAQTGRSIAILPTDGGATPMPAGETGILAIHRTDPGMMLDYWKRPDESARVFLGDWFCGGDLASIDAEGFVRHHGRIDDVMTASGYRISPLEVEQKLASTEGVSEIAVTEVTITDGLNIIVAFVVSGASKDTIRAALDVSAKQQLANYKRPREYVIVETLPRTRNGKIRRDALQKIYDTMKATA